MNVEVVYLNGEFVPAREALVPALGEGVTLGMGLFETMRARKGRVLRLSAHAARLRDSARALGIPCSLSDAQVASIVAELTSANQLDDARVRLTVLARGEQQSDVLCRAIPLGPDEIEPPPVRCVILEAGTAPPASVARHKTINRLAYTLAKRAAQETGADEALLVNARGQVTEATSRNLFVARDGVLATPSLECGLLPGITRGVVLEIARRDRIACPENPLTPDDVRSADECFITSAIVGVLPVRSVDGRVLPGGAPGPVTSRLMTAYRQLAARETAL
jgi:branched-chain amino acid aminotransferase